MEFLIGFLSIVLVFISVVLVMLVLMQRGSANGGLGAAMGGGMAESALGADSSNVLSKWTRNVAIVFFVMVFGLYLGSLWVHERELEEAEGALPELGAGTEQNDASNALLELLSEPTAEEPLPESPSDAAPSPAAPEGTQ